MEHVGPLNQDDLDTCYSVAASYLIDAWRFSHGDKNYLHRTSEVKLALDTVQNSARDSPLTFWGLDPLTERKATDSGVARNAESVKKTIRGFCYTSARSAFESYLKSGSCSILDEERLFSNVGSNLTKSEVLKVIREAYEAEAAENIGSESCYMSPKTRMAPWATDFWRIHSATENGLIRSLSDFYQEKCTIVRAIQPSPEFKERTYTNNNLFIRHIEKHFNSVPSSKGVQPLGINYCAGVLKRGSSYKGVKTRLPVIKTYTALDPACGRHSSVIIGTRVRGSKKEFLVQNSWGSKCTDESGKPLYSVEWECSEGKIWVSAEALSRNLLGLFWLQGK